MKGTFLSLNIEADLFKEIKIQQPQWWNLLCEDPELYVNIRKDNYINVYYYGGSVAKINYNNGFTAKTHQKYLGNDTPRGKTKNGKEKFGYDKINLTNFDKNKLEAIKEYIKCIYLRRIKNENPAEKWIQGRMITECSSYIDSEFQFNQDAEVGKLRIDLVELSKGVLSLVELKGIFDPRLRNDVNRNSKPPEIIDQMAKYQTFINKYENEIKEYYKNLIVLKRDLGLDTINSTQFELNKKPKLVIANTYTERTAGRETRIHDIKKLLEINNIDYEIVPFK